MTPVSALTSSINAEHPPLPLQQTVNAQALHQLKQQNAPSIHAQHIRNITLAYQSRPSMQHDGKDWARRMLETPSKHHPLAVKWAREVLSGGKNDTR